MLVVGTVLGCSVHVQSLSLANMKSETNARQHQKDIPIIEVPDFVNTDPKYRIDCSPDNDEHRTFCQINLTKNRTSNLSESLCTARGCVWDTNSQADKSTCYIPKEKGGYELKQGPDQISNAMTVYSLGRLSSQSSRFSMFNHDIENLKVQVSISGPDMVRMTIRAENAERYEVPVPLQWTPSVPPTSAPPKIQFQMTKTTNKQTGFRILRTDDTQSLLFDTTFFANGFIYDDQFLQIITTIPSRNIYGIFCFPLTAFHICCDFV